MNRRGFLAAMAVFIYRSKSKSEPWTIATRCPVTGKLIVTTQYCT